MASPALNLVSVTPSSASLGESVEISGASNAYPLVLVALDPSPVVTAGQTLTASGVSSHLEIAATPMPSSRASALLSCACPLDAASRAEIRQSAVAGVSALCLTTSSIVLGSPWADISYAVPNNLLLLSLIPSTVNLGEEFIASGTSGILLETALVGGASASYAEIDIDMTLTCAAAAASRVTNSFADLTSALSADVRLSDAISSDLSSEWAQSLSVRLDLLSPNPIALGSSFAISGSAVAATPTLVSISPGSTFAHGTTIYLTGTTQDVTEGEIQAAVAMSVAASAPVDIAMGDLSASVFAETDVTSADLEALNRSGVPLLVSVLPASVSLGENVTVSGTTDAPVPILSNVSEQVFSPGTMIYLTGSTGDIRLFAMVSTSMSLTSSILTAGTLSQLPGTLSASDVDSYSSSIIADPYVVFMSGGSVQYLVSSDQSPFVISAEISASSSGVLQISYGGQPAGFWAYSAGISIGTAVVELDGIQTLGIGQASGSSSRIGPVTVLSAATLESSNQVRASLGAFAWIQSPVPSVLTGLDVDEGDAAVSGSKLVVSTGQSASFLLTGIDPIEGLIARLRMGSLTGGRVRIVLDGSPMGTLVIPSQEEEEDIMPAHSVTEAAFVAATGSATQADIAPRAAPTNRYKVRIVNTHPNDRLYVATSQTDLTTTGSLGYASAQIVEADYGYWEDFLDQSVNVWVRPSGSNAITVRIVQYATL